MASPKATPVFDEKKDDLFAHVTVTAAEDGDEYDEKNLKHFDIQATGNDLARAEERLDTMSLERCRKILLRLRINHRYDQNFPSTTLDHMDDFLDNPDVMAHPERHAALIHAMRLEALLVTDHSPYAEVRAVTESTDDPSMPSFTARVLIIGIIFSGAGAFVNQLFSVRQPGISVSTDIAQLLAYPAGRFLEKVLPTREWSFFGRKFSLNAGRFNKKEHMLITIMCTIGFSTPYTHYIAFVQALPMYFNMPYARRFGYQILNTLGSNFVGYGLAGLCRRFIVYPSYCVWPSSLSTLALNLAFHSDDANPLPGPFKRMFTMTRFKFFFLNFGIMFIYFWIPGYLWESLSIFNWISWIAPTNMTLNNIVGTRNGLGINPWPTWDFNMNNNSPMVTPLYSIINSFAGMWIGFFMIVAFYWTNTWNTGYLPINSNRVFNNVGKAYNVTKILDSHGKFDEAKFQSYSEPWMAAGNIILYFWFFASYAGTISYTYIYHRHQIARGAREAWRDIKHKLGRGKAEVDEDEEVDVHFQMMQAYPEVPEWWYFIVLCLAVGVGVAGLAAYPTYTTPAVIIFGIILALIFTVPLGLIQSITGQGVSLNVLAEFIGGSIVPGDATAMNYFKMYGYITSAHALSFCRDLKMAQYTKIPPRHTFWCQLLGAFISSFVCVSIWNFQMSFKGVCTENASFKMTCPGENTFFTASVFWGTIGPHRLFGKNGHFKLLLLGFPVGFVIPIIQWLLQRKWPKSRLLRLFHPVAFVTGNLSWAPYNMAYQWPGVILAWLSWGYVKPRYLGFWAKYNYILASAWWAGIAVAGVVIFFSLALSGTELDWWGNSVYLQGCEGTACRRLHVAEGEFFGPPPGTFNKPWLQ